MPKEQGHFGECAAHSTSKNAKDKCNSATLRASQGSARRESTGKGEVTNHILPCNSEKDSEKDSGYSEAGSDSVHTDVDDQRSSVSEPHQEGSQISNNTSTTPSMTPYEELTPIYVIKNLVVKPSRPEQLLHGPVAWGGGWHSLANGKAPTQLLLIQQTALPAPSSCTPAPLSCLAPPQGHNKKGGSHSNLNHSSKNSYLPILNSYPRIAPHPRKEIHGGNSGTMWFKGSKERGSDGQSQSKRVCTEEEKREAVSTTSHRLMPQQQHQKEGRAYSQHKGPSHYSSTQLKSHHCRMSSGPDTVSSPSISSSQTPSPPASSDSPSSSSPPSSSHSSSAAHSPYHLPLDKSCTRQRRFLNTAEILNQSGLLAITLRTKELLKQNAATEREITQLRQHTHLLCHIAQSNQNRSPEGSDSLSKLLQAMNESGSYPCLDLHHLKLLGSSKTGSKEGTEKDGSPKPLKTHGSPAQVVSLHRIDNGTSPPSPLFAPSPDTEETGHADGALNPISTALSVSVPEHGHTKTSKNKDLSDLTMFPESSTHTDYF